ncbi:MULTISPECIES: flavin reductase family protein [Prauserella salsuginis group]|uniref:Flavin reductase family protein n=1 Tax=Prauserella salsuginis TaxID=387889 RepID=A0ABW6G0V8_9PSEU|nr:MULTISPECIES: flavin reductase family protein [Prauserella salsuginis group]MCR3721993.1 NADH-FMN oxidoreductase RutF, flavin reductase (DIM6/NTAB) family [Prauserella flava]MCR3735999.1 NADH-FMN oxidoreductase RutF, flavin reductase (DIM6/NTAB) family [Prauserella salsuginis]
MATDTLSARIPVSITDTDAYRRALGHVPTSVAVITGRTRSGPVGMTIGSFTSVSLDPPLIAFYVALGSSTWKRLHGSDRFGVNVLGHAQRNLCAAFSRRGVDRFDGVAWQSSEDGPPLLDDAIVTLECSRFKIDPIGDHYQVVCHVDSLELRADDPPLIFLRGGFVAMDETAGLAAT